MVYTYYLFWFCILFALYKKFYDYALSFFVLFLTSYFIYTRPHDKFLYCIDLISVLFVVFVGFVYYLRYLRSDQNKIYTYVLHYVPIICIILIIMVYFTNIIVYIYKPYPELKNEIIHVLTVIGHLCVMYLSWT